MANSRIMLTCNHCGDQLVIGKGYGGSYYLVSNNMSQQLNDFYRKHEYGICCGDIDCSDCARNHFVILEEGESLDDLIAPSIVRCRDCIKRKKPYECALWEGQLGGDHYFIEHGDDFFCGFGERSIDDECC